MYPQQNDRDIVKTAYHEAAHCVLLLNAKRPFSWVTIIPNGKYLGRVMGVENYQDKDKAVENALIAAAGFTAEAIKFHEYFPPDVESINDESTIDHAVFIRMADFAYGGPTARAYGSLIQTTKYILETRWRDVEKIANALLEHKTLTYEQVLKLCK